MTELASAESRQLDGTGKIVLSDIYNKSDPRSYFSVLRRLDYIIPQLAKPVFRNVIEAYREGREADAVHVVDIGCSYGVNAALLRCDMEMDELYALYDLDRAAGLDRKELLERDRELFAERRRDDGIDVIGLDVAPKAIDYAAEANIIDDGIAANLEAHAPSPACERRLRCADLIISTGCIGYVTETSIERVLEPCLERRPWMAHFALRMFPFDAIQQRLTDYGYVTSKAAGTFRQRRFASAEEREQVFDNLIDLGIDPSGLETEGWYHAEFYLSRPKSDIGRRSAADLAAA